MKKKYKRGLVLLLAAVVITAAALIVLYFRWPSPVKLEKAEINEANFPGEVFREYVRLNFDTDQDGVLSVEELKQAKEINLLDQTPLIYSLKGVEFFVELEDLSCAGHRLTELNLKRNPKLRKLNCRRNPLTQLNLRNNPELIEVYCGRCRISSLDVSRNPKLEKFDCEKNMLEKLDLSHNPKLMYLDCCGNRLAELDLKKNPLLKNLVCDENRLSSLDVSGMLELEYLDCSENRLTEVNISSEKAKVKVNEGVICTGIQDPERIEELGSYWTGVSTPFTMWEDVADPDPDAPKVPIDEKRFPDEVFRAFLQEHFDTDGDGFMEPLDILATRTIEVKGLGIKDLTGIEYFTELEDLNCRDNDLTKLDVSRNTKLRGLYCDKNLLTRLDVSANGELVYLGCSNNMLVELDLTYNGEMVAVCCDLNLLMELDMRHNPKMIYAQMIYDKYTSCHWYK